MSHMGFDRSLATGEEVVAILHPHWKTLVRPILLTFFVVAVLLIGEVLIPASGAAKVKTLVQDLAIATCLLPPLAHRTTLQRWSIWIAAALTVITGAQYLLDGRRALRAVEPDGDAGARGTA